MNHTGEPDDHRFLRVLELEDYEKGAWRLAGEVYGEGLNIHPDVEMYHPEVAEVFSDTDGWPENLKLHLWTNALLLVLTRSHHVSEFLSGKSVFDLEPIPQCHIIDTPRLPWSGHPSLLGRNTESKAFGICKGSLRVLQVFYVGEPDDHRFLRVMELEDYEKGAWRLAGEVYGEGLNIHPDVEMYHPEVAEVFSDTDGWPEVEALALDPNDEDIVYLRLTSYFVVILSCNLVTQQVQVFMDISDVVDVFDTSGLPSFPFTPQWWPTPVPTLPSKALL
ncbi:hypothetical protein Tsubulata_023510 [Turnera subulata]|uniref:DUF1618 domain-containing protein n=1 Tax=Turnera subulata TaxID=218843 RepID=A0A9Q0JQ26_9ROSI|nr:hypothetical protein Tsubulata_023510 [Turnera subulata]